MIIAIDFDGTICKHVYPQIGDPNPNALEVMHKIQAAGQKLGVFRLKSQKKMSGIFTLNKIESALYQTWNCLLELIIEETRPEKLRELHLLIG